MISPAEFIPVAEEMGLIVEIGNCVLREACLRVREMAGRRARRGQHVADPVPARQRRRGDPRGAGDASGLPAEPARDRDHRIGVPQRHRAHAPLARGAAGDGRAHLARRFRHRLFEPQLPAQLSAQQGQDRPLVPAGREQRASGRSTCCTASRGSAPTSACPWRWRASRPRSSSPWSPASAASTRCRASCSARPCRAPTSARCCWRPRRALSQVA